MHLNKQIKFFLRVICYAICIYLFINGQGQYNILRLTYEINIF